MNDTIAISTEFISQTCVVVTLSGRFDAASANVLKDTFKGIIGGTITRVVVDMEGVSFVDSAGLSALITGLKLIRDIGGRLTICSLQPQAKAVFELTKLDQIVGMYPTRQSAIAAATQSTS